MHEMSIAEGIVDIALDTMKNNDGTVVHAVRLRLGAMSGIEPDALLFCFEAVTKGTAAEGAELVIEHVPLKAKCLDCLTEFVVEGYRFICPACQSTTVTTVTGRELQVLSIDMD